MFVEQVEHWRENARRARVLLNVIAQFSKSERFPTQLKRA